MNQKTNYMGPFLTMVFLFFIVGFLTTANTQFQGPLKEAFLSGAGGLKNTFATLITFSWFLAYPLAGPVGSRWVDRRGYKTTLIRGLAVMACGSRVCKTIYSHALIDDGSPNSMPATARAGISTLPCSRLNAKNSTMAMTGTATLRIHLL